jgi:hypothetical protein
LVFSQNYFQFPNDPVSLLEWFGASVALVIVVTLVYVYVLNKTPSPEGIQIANSGQSIPTQLNAQDPNGFILKAEAALKNGDARNATENSAAAVNLLLTRELLRDSTLQVPKGMGIADKAYLVQAKAKSAPPFAETIYQLNNLRLKEAQNQSISIQEASWAVSVAKWLEQIIQSGQVKP